MTNLQLVKNLQNKGVLKTKNIIKAFERIDRKDFVLEKYQSQAYEDIPLPIGYGQTISQPYTVAFMLELLEPKQNQQILDIGSGSAYTSALLAKIIGQNGRVDAYEIIKALIDNAKKNLKNYPDFNINFYLSKDKIIEKINKKYDRILVSAASDNIPSNLIDILKINAKLVIPVNNSIYLISKKKNNIIEKQEFYGFNFVPLINN
jgi:protein-L-isoaspartate(D-aspartate) O-methyltransferase